MKLGINGRFYRPHIKGVQRFAREVAKRLYDMVEVRLFLPRGLLPPTEVPDHVWIIRGILRGHLWEQLELPWRARAASCDTVLHLSGTAPGWGGRHVMVVHDVTPLTDPQWYNPAFARWYRFALARSARRAERIITFSEWGKGEIERVLGPGNGRIDLVSQGIEPFAEPAPASAVARVRERWRLTGPYILATGSGDPRKNLSLLFEIVRQWHERCSEAPLLVVVGEGTPRVHGRRASRQVLDGNIRVTGYVSDEDLRALYTGASVFCYPSFKEGFGRPPLEAMACGTPVVVAPYGVAAEVLDGAARILQPSVEAWIATIEELMTNSSERARQVDMGLRHAAGYSWAKAAKQVMDVCRNVAEGSSSSSG